MRAIPRPQAPLIDRGGLPTREWYTYFLEMTAAASGNPELETELRQILARLAELEQASPINFNVVGLSSVDVFGSPQNGYVQVSLSGDVDSPGATYAYMTGQDGTKGWFLLADATTVTADLTKAVDAGTGVMTLGLADLPDSGTGAALRKITRDSKGRLSGTSAATTTDLAEGTNLYFTNARADTRADGRITAQKGQPNGLASLGADGKVPAGQLPSGSIVEAPIDGYPYVRKDGTWEQTNGPAARFWLIEYPLLTDQAGNQLTDQAGNMLFANSPIVPPGWPATTVTNITATSTPQAMTLAQANALSSPQDFQIVAIVDLAGGREPCWYDASVASGTKWRRFSDRSIAS